MIRAAAGSSSAWEGRPLSRGRQGRLGLGAPDLLATYTNGDARGAVLCVAGGPSAGRPVSHRGAGHVAHPGRAPESGAGSRLSKLSVGVGENPREKLSELARLGALPIIQRAAEELDARRELATSAGRTSNATSAAMRAGCVTDSGRAGCRPPRASSRSRSGRFARRRRRSRPSCSRAPRSCCGLSR